MQAVQPLLWTLLLGFSLGAAPWTPSTYDEGESTGAGEGE